MTARPRLRLAAAAALFLAWLGWLGYAALKKSRAPVVSRAQAAVVVGEPNTAAVFARVTAAADGKPAPGVTVAEALAGPLAAGATPAVPNLPDATGFEGEGEYLLFLANRGGGYEVVGPPTSPGYELSGAPPQIYRRSPDVEAQVRKLLAR